MSSRRVFWPIPVVIVAVLAACADPPKRSEDDDGGGASGGGSNTSAGGAGGGPTPGCVDYGTVSAASCCSDEFSPDGTCLGTMEACSFAAHVMPIFQRACSLSSSCHTGASPKEGLYLGPTTTVTPDASELAAVHGGIVGVPSNRSSFDLVEPGDPGASWIMAKTEYSDFGLCPDIVCLPNCGERMPQGATQLKPHERAQIAAWILAGAQND